MGLLSAMYMYIITISRFLLVHSADIVTFYLTKVVTSYSGILVAYLSLALKVPGTSQLELSF